MCIRYETLRSEFGADQPALARSLRGNMAVISQHYERYREDFTDWSHTTSVQFGQWARKYVTRLTYMYIPYSPYIFGHVIGGRISPLIVSNSTFRLFPDSLQNAATCFNQGFYGTVWGHRKRQSRKTLTQGVFTVFSRVSVSAGRVRGVTIWIYIWLLKVFLCICAQEVFVLCNVEGRGMKSH